MSGNNGNTQDDVILKGGLPNKLNIKTVKHLEFAHLSAGGETSVNFNSLSLPTVFANREGFQNPTPAQLLEASITENKGSVHLHSTARGELQRLVDFYVREDNQIRLTYTTEINEVITGRIENIIKQVTDTAEGAPLSLTGELFEGADSFAIGQEYNVNANPTQQMGELVVHRWQGTETPKLMVRCEANDILNDGNYIEEAGQIRFKEVGRTGGENITVHSNGAIIRRPQGSLNQDLETIAGQVDTISEFLQDVHSLPTNPFQGAPNNVDLRNFGQKVLDNTSFIFGVLPIPSSFLTKLKAVFGIRKVQTKFLTAAVTTNDTDVTDLRFNNLEVGNWYRLSGVIRMDRTSGGADSADVTFFDGLGGNGAGSLIYGRVSSFFDQSGAVTRHNVNIVFQASSSIVIPRVSSFNSGTQLFGNGNRENTWLTLEEEPNIQTTTQWT